MKLTNKNQKELLSFLLQDKELNLFMIGDLVNFGVETKFLHYWGQYKNNQLNAVLMRYYDNFIIYAPDDFNKGEFIDILYDNQFKQLNGKKEIIDQLSNELNYQSRRDTFYTKCDSLKDIEDTNLSHVQKTTIDDLTEVYKLRRKNFGNTSSDINRTISHYKDHIARGFHIKNESGEVIASAETTAETPYSVMVIAVCTDERYRGKGLATQVISKLVKDVLSDNKTLCLMYNNPIAGKIYHKIGFETIAKWSTLSNF